MNDQIIKIVNWDGHYENCRSRQITDAKWCPIPNRFDGDRITELVGEGGASAYGAWCALLLVASRCKDRGVLVRPNGKPHNSRTLSRMTGIDSDAFEKMIVLAQELCLIEVTSPCHSDDAQITRECHGDDIPVLLKGRKEGREGRKEPADAEPCQPTDSEDGQRQKAVGAIGRMLGRELSIAHMQALDTWATSIPPTIGLDGRDVPRWELIDLAASSAIKAGANPRSIGGATKYIARVIESCIRDERLPDERAGPPIDRPRDGSVPFNPKPVKSGLRTDA